MGGSSGDRLLYQLLRRTWGMISASPKPALHQKSFLGGIFMDKIGLYGL